MTESSFDRQDLRQSMYFREVDYSGINPRRFYRHLVRTLQEVREDGKFKYDVEGNQNEDFRLEEENIGTSTGRVEARATARQKNKKVVADLPVRYRSHPRWAGVLAVLAVLVGFGGIGIVTVNDVTYGLGLFGVSGVLGYVGYRWYKERTAWIPVQQFDVLRVFIHGEATERSVEVEGETRTDVFGNMSTAYTGDAYLAISTGKIEDDGEKIKRKAAEKAEAAYPGSDSTGGLPYDSDDDLAPLERIEKLQRSLEGNPELRRRYTEELHEEIPDGRSKISEHIDDLTDELKSLTGEMETYVERERIAS